MIINMASTFNGRKWGALRLFITNCASNKDFLVGPSFSWIRQPAIEQENGEANLLERLMLL
jgi:hypothetical protein